MISRLFAGIILFILFHNLSSGQTGGRRVYEFLNLPESARIASLGGNAIAVQDEDVMLGFHNPSALNPLIHTQVAFNHNFSIAGIQNGGAAYGHYLSKLQMPVLFGIRYVDYGDIDETDVFGNVIGSFNPKDLSIHLGTSRQIDERISIGANLKFIQSSLGQFQSNAVAIDAGITYQDTSKQFLIALVLKNAGAQLTAFNEQEDLPFELQLGVSKRLRYLPFRFSIVYRYLDRWNVLYDDPDAESGIIQFGDEPSEESEASFWFDNFFRHFVFNGAFLFGRNENLRLRFGYSHLIRKELSLSNVGSLAGFSMGIGIKVNRFRIDYGRSVYHAAGGANHFGISTSFTSFLK